MTPEQVEAKNDELLRAYRLTFKSPAGQLVLLDLMSFGKFRVAITDPVDEGKRQVVLRIMNFTELSMEQLQAAYRGQISPRPAQGAHGHDDQSDPLE
jgi:hypothetical protein